MKFWGRILVCLTGISQELPLQPHAGR